MPIFATLDKFPLHDPIGNDWYKECGFNRSAREAIIQGHQFALRSAELLWRSWSVRGLRKTRPASDARLAISYIELGQLADAERWEPPEAQ